MQEIAVSVTFFSFKGLLVLCMQAWLDKHPNVKYVPHKGLVKSDVKHEMRAWAKRESAKQHPDIPAAAQPGGPVPITGVAAQGQQSSGRKHSAVPTKSGTGSSDEQPPTQNVLDVPLSKRRRLLTPPVSKAVSQGQPGSGIRNDSIMQQAKTAAGSQVTAAHMRPPPLQGPGEQNATAATASSEHVARMQQQLTAALQDQDVEHRKLWDDIKQLKAEVAELQCSAKSQGQQEGETSKGRLQCIVNVGRVSRKRMDVEAHLLGLLTILQQLGKMSVSKSVAEALKSSQHGMEIRKILLDIVE
jgi:hypothetical protein